MTFIGWLGWVAAEVGEDVEEEDGRMFHTCEFESEDVPHSADHASIGRRRLSAAF